MQDFIDALQQDTYSFIPTMSALAIDEPNWYATPNLNDSPFVNFYIPTENEDHVTVTAASAQFALDEIRQTLNVNDFSEGVFQLLQNPVEQSIRLGILENLGTVKTQLFSLTGQLLQEKQWEGAQTKIVWEHQLATGLYLLTVSNDIHSQEFKILVK